MQYSGAEPKNDGTGAEPRVARAAAVLVPCSSRKSMLPGHRATAVSLPRGTQADVETAWRDRLGQLPLACTAGTLYAGRGIQLGRQTAAVTGGTLLVVSAGLGLVAADRVIPAYGLTVGGRGPESIAPRVNGRLNLAAWWRAVSAGPFSTDLATLFGAQMKLPVLIALTQPYARLLAPALDDLGDMELACLRIAGIGLADFLPERISRQLLPYDARLESVLPGTKTDFAQRALFHFAQSGLAARPAGDVSEHRAWVERALAGRSAPVRPTRLRLSDDEILDLIEQYLPQARGIGRLLRVLRDQEGVACEQARFTRLYRAAIKRSAA